MRMPEAVTFVRPDGYRIFLPDLIWLNWRDGKLPMSVESRTLDLTPPKDVYQEYKGQKSAINSVEVDFRVFGLVVRFRGSAEQFSLLNPRSAKEERFHFDLSFGSKKGGDIIFEVDQNLVQFFSRIDIIADFLKARPISNLEFQMLKLLDCGV